MTRPVATVFGPANPQADITRRRIREAVLELLAQGTTPTIRKVREKAKTGSFRDIHLIIKTVLVEAGQALVREQKGAAALWHGAMPPDVVAAFQSIYEALNERLRADYDKRLAEVNPDVTPEQLRELARRAEEAIQYMATATRQMTAQTQVIHKDIGRLRAARKGGKHSAARKSVSPKNLRPKKKGVVRTARSRRTQPGRHK